MNEWKVLSNPVGGEYVYQVYRIRNHKEPMHSGNIQLRGPVFDSQEEAQAYADAINESAAEKSSVCTLLVPVLQRTRNLRELESLEYDDEREIVYARFSNGGTKVVDVAMDSGTSMILDIVRRIV